MRSLVLAMAVLTASTAFAATPPCTAVSEKVTTIGTTFARCPTSQLSGRNVTVVCNSAENTGSPLLKVRVDGNAPVMGASTGGTVLAIGQCASFMLADNAVPLCIASAPGTLATTIEGAGCSADNFKSPSATGWPAATNPLPVIQMVPDAGAKPVHEVGPNPGVQQCVICGAAPDGGQLTVTPGTRYVWDVVDNAGSAITWAVGQYAVNGTAPGVLKNVGSYQLVAPLPMCDAGTCLAPTTVTCVADNAATSAPWTRLCVAPEQAQ